MLDAVWALIPSAVAAVSLVWRTALEDKMLREELEGYQNYTERTRHRLLPGVW
jgi:protein-S-isoprenylcysteine O-methyltransferase Ste14